MRGLLLLPALWIFAAWDLSANHGEWTLLVLRGLRDGLRALGFNLF